VKGSTDSYKMLENRRLDKPRDCNLTVDSSSARWTWALRGDGRDHSARCNSLCATGLQREDFS